MINPAKITKIHIFPNGEMGDGNAWQMNTMYEGSDGWHIVYGETIEECLAQEFSTPEPDDCIEEEIDVWA